MMMKERLVSFQSSKVFISAIQPAFMKLVLYGFRLRASDEVPGGACAQVICKTSEPKTLPKLQTFLILPSS